MNSGFTPSLRHAAARSADTIVRDAEGMLNALLDLSGRSPSRYGWRFRDVAALRAQCEEAESIREINQMYWHDVARTIEAYDVLVLWRATELAKSSTALLGAGELLAAAPVVRALLELGATAIINVNNLEKWIAELFALAERASPTAIVATEHLDAFLAKLIYGTRMGEPPEHLQQTNIMTFIQRIGKNSAAAKLPRMYEYLSDVCHPNVGGFQRFALESQMQADGSEIRVLARSFETPASRQICECALWALSWSWATVKNAFEIGQVVTARVLARWPPTDTPAN